MPSIRDTVKTLVSDGRLSRADAQQLITQVNADATITPTEKADLTQVLARYADAFDPDAWQLMQSSQTQLGVTVGDLKPPDLSNRPELADVAAGRKTLSTTRNSSDPAVLTVQKALMALARLEGNPAYGLPSGADGSFGNECKSAVKAFQTAHGLGADGTVGPRTLAAIVAEVAKAQGAVVTPPATLGNARFASDATLGAIAKGGLTLAAGAKGATVVTVQQALMDLGYAMPKYGADGGFGGELKHALLAFQKDQRLPASGVVDAATMKALDAAAPAPGAKAVHYPEYDQMYADGVLDVTLGIGFDEDGSDLVERKKVQDGLADRGFRPLDVTHLTDAQLTQLGLHPERIDRQATYYVKDSTFQGKPVKVLVKYVDRDSVDPRARFGSGLQGSDLVLYGGHARYGSGPDFDDINSPAGNWVLGANDPAGPYTNAYNEHIRGVLAGQGNDLARTTLTPSYQMMLFSGCTTLDYLDELRGIPANKTEANLDLVVSDNVLYWNNNGANVLAGLDGVLGGKSENDIEASLVAINSVPFTSDGFGGNHFQPAGPS
jgi:peptidoglycan hydrolase-like protein with peptidoglycan-binding domain